MSIKTYYKVKEVKQKTEVLKEIRCSRCGKLLNVRGKEIVRDYCKRNGLYYTLTTGHNLWGNDSCDSIEIEEYCEECLKKVFEEWMKQARNTHYFKVECEGYINSFEEYSTDGLEER